MSAFGGIADIGRTTCNVSYDPFIASLWIKALRLLLSKPMEGLPATLISILWRLIAAIGPRLGPAFVDWNLAIIDTLLVFPFLTEPFLASEFLQLHSIA